MTPAQHQRAKEIFLEACELPRPQQESLLAARCSDDALLAGEVRRLLAHDDPDRLDADSGMRDHLAALLDEPSGATSAAADAHPDRIGPYRIIRPVGEGGFGTVYQAEQTEPVRRTVAVKVIKPGMDSRHVIARFAAERQALAMMNHPGIATVFDAGMTEAGRPYFAMELVEGAPISTYCDARQLDLQGRLSLFLRVCGAIQHAHQKGIIHRDLKPSNVLVTDVNHEPAPKVIDFGIAKAAGPGAERPALTAEQGHFVGTPEYMSPEQASGDRDIDTRTDIYSMGVMLYELVSGTTPLDRTLAATPGPSGLLELIRRSDPPTPSTRLRTLGDQVINIARRRRTDPASLRRMLRGDLDWIVMKAIDRDRSRRYETMSAFGEDVHRFLHHEPVLARPPGNWYRFSKFARRNRAALAASLIMLLLLVAGVVGTSVGLVRALAAKEAESTQRLRAQAINQMIQAALQSSDPSVGGKQDILVSEAMQRVVRQLEAGVLTDHPETEAELLLHVARTLEETGHPTEALPLAERALSTYESLRPRQPALVARAHEHTGKMLEELGRAKDSEEHYKHALHELRQPHAEVNPDVARLTANLAVAVHAQGRLDDAERLYLQAMAMRKEIGAAHDSHAATLLSNLASVLQAQGRNADAEPYFRDSLAMWQRLVPGDHPGKARTLGDLALILMSLRRAPEALPLAQESYEMAERLFPQGHLDAAIIRRALALALDAGGKTADAEPLLKEALDLCERLAPGDHPQTALVRGDLAGVLIRLKRQQEAEPLLRSALEMNQRLYPGGHQACVMSAINLAACLANLGRFPEAVQTGQAAVDLAKRLWPDGHPSRSRCEATFGQITAAAERRGSGRDK